MIMHDEVEPHMICAYIKFTERLARLFGPRATTVERLRRAQATNGARERSRAEIVLGMPRN